MRVESIDSASDVIGIEQRNDTLLLSQVLMLYVQLHARA